LRLRIYGELGSVEVQHRHDWSKLFTCLGADAETGTWTEVDGRPGADQLHAVRRSFPQRARTSSPASATPPISRRCWIWLTVTDRDRTEHKV
jgi:hypothetical protein